VRRIINSEGIGAILLADFEDLGRQLSIIFLSRVFTVRREITGKLIFVSSFIRSRLVEMCQIESTDYNECRPFIPDSVATAASDDEDPFNHKLIGLLLLVLRKWIDHIAVPFSIYFNAYHLASDGKRSYQGVVSTRNIRYGELTNECMDILEPSCIQNGSLSGMKYILYAHGGGFVSVHRAVLSHSMTPLVRAGFTVFSIDYPLSPEFRYPTAIISVLKALSLIHSRFGVKSVQLVGDSAGGSLISMAAGIVANPEMPWHPNIKEFLTQNTLPEIESVSLVYAICDTESWMRQDNLSIPNKFISWILRICISLYRSSSHDRVTVAENLEKILTFPPTFLLCGHTDLLIASHEVFETHLKSINVPVKSVITKGFHGYHGLPVPFSFGLWRTTVFPATCELIRFLTGGNESRVPVLPRRSVFEYDFHLLIVLCVVHLIPFFAIWIFL
jgi:acetyl esterase/lipase